MEETGIAKANSAAAEHYHRGTNQSGMRDFNERLVLKAPEVVARLKALGVTTVKADWTRYDPGITRALSAFGRSGVPFYVIYRRDPGAAAIQLPEILTTEIVLSALGQIDSAQQRGAPSIDPQPKTR